MAYDPIPFVDASGVAVWSAKVAGDSNNRAQITADGQMSWGPGNAAVDTFQSRSAAGIVAFGEVDGTAAHGIYVYNSRSASGANYERGVFDWTITTDTLSIGTAKQGTGSSRAVNFLMGGVTRWQIAATGYWVPGNDNGLDAGGSSKRIRSIYWGTQALGPDGSVSAPTYSFASNTDYGVFLRASGVSYAIGGAERFRMTDTIFLMGNAVEFGWASSSQTTVAKDLALARDAANTLAQRNGTNPQVQRWYGTFTNSSNYERFTITTSAGVTDLLQEQAGTGTVRGLRIGPSGNGSMLFHSNGTDHFRLTGGGNLTWDNDNANDIGASAATRPRSIYWGTQALGPNGSVSAASFGFALEVNSGLIRTGTGILSIALTGDERFRWDKANGRTVIGSAWAMTWSSTSTADGAPDLFLYRDAANTLAQRNGTNPQTFHIYETHTNASNYSRMFIQMRAAASARIYTEAAGTGTLRGLKIGTSGSAALDFVTNGTDRWRVDASGHYVTPSDNALDIGASAATRPRSLYLGTQVSIGTNPATGGAIRFANNDGVQWRNNANDGNITALTVNSADEILLGVGDRDVSIADGSSAKLGLFQAAPVVQPGGTGETTGFVAGSGTGVNDDSTFTGNVGTKAYRISDMVKALKNLGAMAAS